MPKVQVCITPAKLTSAPDNMGSRICHLGEGELLTVNRYFVCAYVLYVHEDCTSIRAFYLLFLPASSKMIKWR